METSAVDPVSLPVAGPVLTPRWPCVAPKAQEIVVARGHTLELLRPDEASGKLVSMLSVQTFSVIRSLEPFRLHGSTRDYVVCGTDSGKISILECVPIPAATTVSFPLPSPHASVIAVPQIRSR